MPTLSRRIRKHERAFYYVVTAIIAVSFFFWGTADYSDPKQREELGVVGGRPVTRAELNALTERAEVLALLEGFTRSPQLSSPQARYRWFELLIRARQSLRDPQSRAMYQAIMGLGDLGDLSRNDVRENVAWRWLAYIRAAEAAGLRVNPDEVPAFVRMICGWMDPSRPFPVEAYQRRVRADHERAGGRGEGGLGLRVEAFEAALADFLLVSRYFDAVGETAGVTAQEVLDFYLEENREVEIAWVGFKPADFAGRVTPPARDAVARYFEGHRGEGDFKIPAKVQVEYLLADREAFLAQVPEPSEADIKVNYDARMKTDFKNPDGGKDGKPEYKPLEEVRGEIVKDLKKGTALNKALDALQDVLQEIGKLEVQMRRDPSVKIDFEEFAKRSGAVRGLSHFVSESQADDLEKLFGAFRDPRGRDALRRKLFKDMKPGEVMAGESKPLLTDKGALIYRLVQRKEARVPDQLTAEAEEEILAKLRREAQDKLAAAEAQRLADRVNAVGLTKAEEECRVALHRPPPLKVSSTLPDPSGEHGGPHPDGHRIAEAAFSLRQQNQAGKARFVDGGPGQAKFVVVLQRALEAKMDDFAAQKERIKDQILDGGWRSTGMVPGKRRLVIDAKREELEKTIRRKGAEEPKAPAPAPAPPAKR